MQAAGGRNQEDRGAPLICIGEALVDLICPDPLNAAADAKRFEVHFGGALANVAVAASRAGAPASLAGGCGDDDWGTFLRDRLRAEGVALDFHTLLPGIPTPFAFATLDHGGEPSFRIHPDGIEQGIATLAGREEALIAAAGAIQVGSNTLPGAASRTITFDLCRAAAAARVPVLVDPNLRPNRWSDLDRARELCLELVECATVLKSNVSEARWLAGVGEDAGPADAAEALLGRGPELVVVTAGTDPAVARGACTAEVTAPDVDVVCPLGAGDVFMGTLAAGLHETGWELGRAGAAMERAAAAAAETCTRLGAFDG